MHTSQKQLVDMWHADHNKIHRKIFGIVTISKGEITNKWSSYQLKKILAIIVICSSI